MARKATDDSLLWVVHDNLITVREFGEFIIIALFHNTPLWVIVFTAMLLLILSFTKEGWKVLTFK